MNDGHAAGVARGLRALWEAGSVGGLTDGQLLARFVERRDEGGELAFEALVARHGPMVLRVALDVLRDPHSAEDAFQATFLVLARKARSIARPEALGPWLYGVAHRVARKARVEAGRRRRHESVAAGRASETFEPSGDFESWPGLHEEIARLPKPCRLAVMLCYFEGLTYEQAARRLGVGEATVRGRLARARRALRGRLLARGGVSWTLPIVPGRWIGPTARAASRFARGIPGAGPSRAEGLAGGVLRIMALSKWKAAALLVALHVVAIAGVMAGQSPTAEPPSLSDQAIPRPEVPELIRRPEEPARAEQGSPRLAFNLDQAIERLLRDDPELGSRFYEIPRARADRLNQIFLTARPSFWPISPGRGKNANVTVVRKRSTNEIVVPLPDPFKPVLDVNNLHQVGLTANRLIQQTAPSRADRSPKTIREAQYLDAAREKFERLSLAFGEALKDRDLANLHREANRRAGLLASIDREEDRQIIRKELMFVAGRRSWLQMAPHRAVRTLASLLAISEEGSERLEVVGRLADGVHAPPLDALNIGALATRPDLIALRLGLARAKADHELGGEASFRRFQPYLFDKFPPGDLGHADALRRISLGLLPRDLEGQAAERTRLNVDPDRNSIEALQQQVLSEVKQARREYEASLFAVEEAEEESTSVGNEFETAWARYQKGTQDLTSLLLASRKAEEVGFRLLERRARNNRAKVALNAAVGRRALP